MATGSWVTVSCLAAVYSTGSAARGDRSALRRRRGGITMLRCFSHRGRRHHEDDQQHQHDIDERRDVDSATGPLRRAAEVMPMRSSLRKIGVRSSDTHGRRAEGSRTGAGDCPVIRQSVWPARLLLAGAIIHGAAGLAAAATPSEHEEPPAPGSQAPAVDADERWRIEYVRRPQTLPARGVQIVPLGQPVRAGQPVQGPLGSAAQLLRVDAAILGLAAGLRLVAGRSGAAGDRLPGHGEPSACSGYSRAREGLGVDFAVEPTGRAKLKVFGRSYLDRCRRPSFVATLARGSSCWLVTPSPRD